MHGRGAKGSVRNRIYQFWLIRLFLEKKEKRKQQKLLKKKQKEEAKKKWDRELFYNQEPKINWKLSKSPSIFRKKEGVVVTLYPIGKKPDKVIEVAETKKVGMASNEEVKTKLTQIVASSIKTIDTLKKEVQKQPKEKTSLENKNKQLKSQMKQIENLQNQYHSIVKKNPAFSKLIVTIPTTNQKIKVEKSMSDLSQMEVLCKQELKRMEIVLSNLNAEKEIRKVEKESLKDNTQTVRKDVQTGKKEEKKSLSNLQRKTTTPLKTQIEKSKIPVQLKKEESKISIPKMSQTGIVNNHIPKNTIENKAKKGMSIALTGGTLIAFPALLQSGIFSKKKTTENKKPLLDNSEKKKQQEQNNKESKLKDVEAKKKNDEEEKKQLKLKLYKTKLQASKEAEILIQSEINRQKDYLKYLNKKVNTLDITVKKKYHFQGIHHLISNVLKFTLGVFTIPFSRKKIFGTVVGITLINNSIRGLKNSFKKEEEQVSYIEFKDLSKMIYSEKVALLKTKDLIVDSLEQLSDLKKELENEFYGKVSFDEYEQMKDKIKAIEKTLLEKEKEILKAQESLEKVEEKNKIKVKRLDSV